MMDISELKPDPANPRERTTPNRVTLAKSLEQFGLARSIVLDADNTVIAGNGTVEAAIAAGKTRVIVVDVRGDELVAVRRSDWTADQARAYAVADNRSSELSRWDIGNLDDSLAALAELGREPIDLGFTATDLAALHDTTSIPTRPVDPAALTPHPRNYREHPDAQVAQLAESIKQHGIFKNVVVCRGGVILAGHGVVRASLSLGLKTIPAVVLDVEPDSAEAIRVIVADNELSTGAVDDDRALVALLKEIEGTGGLYGTGFDDKMLAALDFVTRPPDRLTPKDQSAWEGMPDYGDEKSADKLIVTFEGEGARESFAARLGVSLKPGEKSMPWPPRLVRKESSEPSAIVFDYEEES